MTITILGVLLVFATGVATAVDFSESEYRAAGTPGCKDNMVCAVGVLQGKEALRFKIYVASDPELNGRVVKLDPDFSPGSVQKGVILLQFSGVLEKTLVDATVIGPAPAPSGSKSRRDPQRAEITTIDLTSWKVTLPVSKPEEAGGAMEVTDLVGFTMPPYFDVQPHSITFSASVSGARTSGSKYPRSELREMDGDGEEFEWTVSEGGRLSATLAVLELPTRTSVVEGVAPAPVPIKVPAPGRIVVGQIHGPDDELCRLYYDNGVLYFNNDKSGPKQEQISFALKSASGNMTSIPLGSSFSYVINVGGNRLNVEATYNGVIYRASDEIGKFWRGKGLYFKAGAYVQAGKASSGAREIGSGTGSVRFTAISVKH